MNFCLILVISTGIWDFWGPAAKSKLETERGLWADGRTCFIFQSGNNSRGKCKKLCSHFTAIALPLIPAWILWQKPNQGLAGKFCAGRVWSENHPRQGRDCSFQGVEKGGIKPPGMVETRKFHSNPKTNSKPPNKLKTPQ